jgi:hypothetical protein
MQATTSTVRTCGAPTKNGNPCRALPSKGCNRCFRHLEQEIIIIKPKTKKKADDEDTDNDCVICYAPMNSVTTLHCKHKFCTECITGWFNQYKKSCPMCRQPVTDQRIRAITGKAVPVPVPPPPPPPPAVHPAFIQAVQAMLPDNMPLPPPPTLSVGAWVTLLNQMLDNVGL